MYDRVVIQDILKEIAQTQQVDLNAKQRFKGEQITEPLRADWLTPQSSSSTRQTR
jgi:replication factor C subunit 3/5